MRLSPRPFVWLALLVAGSTAEAAAQHDADWFAALEARSIGPAGMSGRISAVDALVANPNLIYAGAGTGGVWKSEDGGTTWTPVMDEAPVSSIGAVAINQTTPEIVWVGTGEKGPRNSAGVGRGVYKTVDGGDSWTLVGLESSERIAEIILHPTNPEVAYVAALGPTWADSPARGVFKTSDGGTTWTKILYVDEQTGAADLIMDPVNPNKLFAAMWSHRRWPWFFRSGGEGSGLHVTYDGGDTWRRLTENDGLPAGELGRIGLAVARSNPNVVYALVEATKSELIRSADGGRSWRTVNNNRGIANRPFYYGQIRVDPENENRVYNIFSAVTVSEDGGANFRALPGTQRIHSDHHAFWIHPHDGRLIIDGNDGGIAISRDRGGSFRFVENIPLAQFYHINVDMATPFNVYGGLQDNGSWRGPSQVWENGGIRNYHWKEVGFGDGFATLIDPSNPRYGYSMSQGGNLSRFDVVTGARKPIRPWAPDTVELRFNWNAGIAIDTRSPFNVYYGSQFVHRSPDRGDSWEIISPDLTTNDPEKQRQRESGGLTLDVTAAENHTAILTIAPSAPAPDVIWVGTDDGNVQITRDGGANWTNVRDRIPDVPPNSWVAHVEASKFDPATAFVVFDDHRRGNWATYVFETRDYGATWRNLATDDLDGFVHAIEQDPVNPNLLYVGTEFGMFVTLDRGASWFRWTHGLPTVPVRAMIVHPRDNDLVIGTHGRGVFIVDDVRPLQEASADIIASDLHLFVIPPAYQVTRAQPDGYRFTGDAMYRGENRDDGALISYWIGEDGGRRRVRIEITNEAGEEIRTLQGPRRRGVNRVAWNLRQSGPPRAPLLPVLPGMYTARIELDETVVTRSFEVRPDPREFIALADRRAKFAVMQRLATHVSVLGEANSRMRGTLRKLQPMIQQVLTGSDSTVRSLRREATSLRDNVQALIDQITPPVAAQGTGGGAPTVSSYLQRAAGMLQASWNAPTPNEMIYVRQAEDRLSAFLDEVNTLYETDYAAFRADLRTASLDPFDDAEPLTINRGEGGRAR